MKRGRERELYATARQIDSVRAEVQMLSEADHLRPFDVMALGLARNLLDAVEIDLWARLGIPMTERMADVQGGLGMADLQAIDEHLSPYRVGSGPNGHTHVFPRAVDSWR